MNAQQTRSRLWTALRLGTVALVFVLLVNSGLLDPGQLASALDRPGLFLLGAACFLAQAILSVLRWRKLLEVQQIPVSFTEATRLTFIGLFFSAAIPGAVSGDIVKAYYVVRGREKKAEAILTILLDRVVGLYSILAVGAVVMLVAWLSDAPAADAVRKDPRLASIALSLWAILLAMTVGFFLAASARIRSSGAMMWLLGKTPFRNTVQTLYDAAHLYGRHPKQLLQALLYSFLAQIPLFAGLYFMAQTVGAQGIPMSGYLFIFPVGLIANAIPLLPGGLGQAEAAFEWLFGFFKSDRGAETALLFHAAQIAIAVGIGGVVYLLGAKNYDMKAAEESHGG